MYLRLGRVPSPILTVEQHTIVGGLGGAVAEHLSRTRPTRVEMVGIRDTFGESGSPDALLRKYGITVKAVVEAAQRALAD